MGRRERKVEAVRVGEVVNTDPNGVHLWTVGTDGEFWRVVYVQPASGGLHPENARKLARLLMRAADWADREIAAWGKVEEAERRHELKLASRVEGS